MSILLAIGPMFFKMMNDKNNKRFYSKILTYMAFFFMLIVLVLSMFSEEVIKILAKNQEYWQAYILVPFLSFSIFFSMLKDVTILGLNIVKRTKVISAILIVVCLINTGLNYFLIPAFGIIGSALSALLTQMIYFILIYINAQKWYPVPYELKKIIVIVLTGTSLAGISYSLSGFNSYIEASAKFLLILIFPFILYFFNFYERIEIIRIRETYRKFKNPKSWIYLIKNKLKK